MLERDTFLEQAEALLGPRGLSRDAEVMAPWLVDWRGRYTGQAIALASPASTTEVAELVKLCAAHGVPIVPQGGNSGMCGGATPDDSGAAILLSLRRMDAISTLDAEAGMAVCGAGVILQNLHEAADNAGMRFPLTLGGKGSATIGGLISTNAGGTQVLRHGTMRAQVLGIEAVLPDGGIYDSLAPLKKDNRGFDLKQLLIGSEGTLGIVTAATLRLLPAVAGRAVLWAGVESLHHARQLLLRAQTSAGDALEGFEVMPRHSLEAVLAHLPDARDPLGEAHAWYALIELIGTKATAGNLTDLAEKFLAEALESELLQDATIAANESQAEQLWLLRDSISGRATLAAARFDLSG
jgi:FAD/FMN-containing dehydrogenase